MRPKRSVSHISHELSNALFKYVQVGQGQSAATDAEEVSIGGFWTSIIPNGIDGVGLGMGEFGVKQMSQTVEEEGLHV